MTRNPTFQQRTAAGAVVLEADLLALAARELYPVLAKMEVRDEWSALIAVVEVRAEHQIA